MNGNQPNPHQGVCPRCGADADWSYVDAEKSRVEIVCPDCGRYEMTREAFDQLAVESAEVNEPNPGDR